MRMGAQALLSRDMLYTLTGRRTAPQGKPLLESPGLQKSNDKPDNPRIVHQKRM